MNALDLLHLLPRKEKERIGISCRPNERRQRQQHRLKASGLVVGDEAEARDEDVDAAVASSQESVASGRVQHKYKGKSIWGKWGNKHQKKKRGMKQLQAQALHHNRRGGAKTPDNLMMAKVSGQLLPASLSRRGIGKGGWKKYTSEAMCKIAFSNLYSSFDAIKSEGGSKSHAMKLMWAMATIIDAQQKAATGKLRSAASSHGDVADDFQINNNMFDESRLWLKSDLAAKVGRKRLRSILASATQVTRRAPGCIAEDIDIIRVPAKLAHYTAASCAGVLAQPDDCAGLLPDGDAVPNVTYFGSITATDSHAVNKLVSKWISAGQEEMGQRQEENGPDFRGHIASYCTQHKTGSAVQEVTEYLGLIRPGFALASVLSTGDIADDLDFQLRMVIELELEVVDPVSIQLDAPDDLQTQEFLSEVFEKCYVQATGHSAVSLSVQEQEQKRREEAKQILEFFSASRGRRLRHSCPPGCCVEDSLLPAADRAASVEKAFGLVKRFVAPCITEPAANKYTKVDAVMRKLALATNFFGLLRRAFGRKFNDSAKTESERSDFSVDAAIGAPQDQMRHWRKVKHIKLNRSYDFLKQRSSEYLPLIWLCVCSVIMVVHYKLFKNGTWYSHRQTRDRYNIFDFCSDAEENPICEALSLLAAMMVDPEGAGKRPLALLFLKFGQKFSEWPRHVRNYLDGSLCIAFSVLWRKLFHDFKQYPWLLAPAFDLRRSMLARRATLQRFLVAPKCCLDKGLCMPLRKHTTSIDDYFDSVLHDFLVALYLRTVVTSTQVELIFGKLSRLTTDDKGGAGLATLASKFMIASFEQAVQRWRAEKPIIRGRPLASSNKCRAPWMFTMPQGTRTNHLHVLAQGHDGFVSSSSLKARFDSLPAEEQDARRREAKSIRDVSGCQPSRLDESVRALPEVIEGPLGMATRASEPFPIRTSVVRQAIASSSTDTLATKWRNSNTEHSAPLEGFPETISAEEVCVGTCKGDLRLPDDTEGRRGFFKLTVSKLLHHFQLACRFATATKTDPTILLRFDDDCDDTGHTEYILVASSSYVNNKCFEATCFRMVPSDGQVDRAPPPLLLRYDCQEVEAGLWPCIESEADLVRRFVALSPRWEIYQAINRRTDSGSLSRLATAVEPLRYENLLQLEEKQREQAAAIRALRTVTKPPKAASRRGATRRATCSSGRKRKKSKEQVSSASDQSEPSETEQYWREIMASFSKKKVKTSAASGSGTASGPPAPSASPDVSVASASGQVEAVPRRKSQARDWKAAINGGHCFFEAYGGTGGSIYENWIFKCDRHENCMKTRGVAKFSTKNYGELEPLAFVHAWRDMVVPPTKSHRQCNPTLSDVQIQMDANMTALAELNAQFQC